MNQKAHTREPRQKGRIKRNKRERLRNSRRADKKKAQNAKEDRNKVLTTEGEAAEVRQVRSGATGNSREGGGKGEERGGGNAWEEEEKGLRGEENEEGRGS